MSPPRKAASRVSEGRRNGARAVDAPVAVQALSAPVRDAPPVDLAVPVSFALPPEFVEAVADRAADLLARRLDSRPEPWIGVDDAAEHLACPVSRIYRLVSLAKGGRQANAIPYCKDGQRLLFRRSELDAWTGRGGGPCR